MALDTLQSLWIAAKAVTEAAGTFGSGAIGTAVKAFLNPPLDANGVRMPLDPGLADQVGPVTLGTFDGFNSKPLTQIMADSTPIFQRVLTANGEDGSKYAACSFDINTTLFDLALCLIGQFNVAHIDSPAAVPDSL